MHLDTIIQHLHISIIPMALWSRYDNSLLHLFTIQSKTVWQNHFSWYNI